MDADEVDALLETRQDNVIASCTHRTLSAWNVDGVIDQMENIALEEETDDLPVSSVGPPFSCCLRWCVFRAPFHEKGS